MAGIGAPRTYLNETRKHNKLIRNRKGFMFTMDALLASAILVGGLILISQNLIKEHPRENLEYLTTDVLTVLSELRIDELPDSLQSYLNTSPNTNGNLSVLEQIGTYWATGEIAFAQNLSDSILQNLFPNNTGMHLTFENDVVFEHSQTVGSTDDLVAGERMITGIAQGAPLSGSTSSAYLRRISDKRTSSFAYFGGFVGQGEISAAIERIPTDVDASDITKIIVELNAVAPFNLYINGIFCDLLTPINTNMTPDKWDVTFCNSSINSVTPGINNVTLDFQGNINQAYVMGGNIRVDYKTDELQQTISTTSSKYQFPEITGIVNLFDSFYVPGNLTRMQIMLHYLADHSVMINNTFYLTIGNTTVWIDTSSITEQNITLDDALLRTIINYSDLSRSTVPLRMGFENLTYESQLLGNSEVMLVTDVSGSMDWKMVGADWDNGNKWNCDDPQINDSDTQRLSVAKCLDKKFAFDVLNISGNTIGLVSYSTSTDTLDTVAPTTNLTRINNVIGTANPDTGYNANGNTCICCGINSARNELIRGAVRTVLIANKTSWKNNTHSFLGLPANDSEGDAWYEFDYDDTGWSSGNAVLGHDAGTGGVPVNTELGSSALSSEVVYANLWENAGDVAGPPNDFTSGTINSTANTFGVSGANDGWDWAGGASAYGYDNDVDFNGASGSHLNMDFRTGSPARNRCSGYDCSGAYGITVNITSQMITLLSNNGAATLSFYYEWNGNDDPFEGSDEFWIKGKWIRPNGSEYWLGTHRDSTHNNGDTYPEIYAVDNPNQEFQGYALIDLTSMISTAGLYYLHLGGKLRADGSDEWGYAYLDNIQIRVSNHTDHYYFRKHFNIADLSLVRRGVLNFLSDDRAKVYLNGNLVFDGQENLNGTYWDRRGIFIDSTYFMLGDNVVAVDLTNEEASAKFDLELVGINKTEQGAMLIMTDGQANEECSEQGTTGDLDGDGSSDTASDDAIQAACTARQRWGIQVFAVGFSASSDEPTLQGMAYCGEGLYAKSDNTSALSDFYNQVVLHIISATVRSQTIILTGGNLSASNLYGDSYINYTYTPIVEEPQPNEISVEMQSQPFNSCSPSVNIPSGIRIMDAKVTSYSGEHWTRTLIINSNLVYNLSGYGSSYIRLGDPYLVHAPPNLFVNGTNQFYTDTGDDYRNSTGCSKNNSLIYTALVPSSTARSEVVEHIGGCAWTLQFEDNSTSIKLIPDSYAGSKTCSFTENNHTLEDGSYDPTDAYDVAVFNLLKELDFDDNGKIFVNLDSTDIEIVITTVSSVPYLWGPTLVKAKVWQ
jgi:hypothetical protein